MLLVLARRRDNGQEWVMMLAATEFFHRGTVDGERFEAPHVVFAIRLGTPELQLARLVSGASAFTGTSANVCYLPRATGWASTFGGPPLSRPFRRRKKRA